MTDKPQLTIADLRPEVVAFALLMERELRVNDHKGGWKNDDIRGLTAHAEAEMRELDRAVAHLDRQIGWREANYPRERGNGWSRINQETGKLEVGFYYRADGDERRGLLTEVISEAADLANMAMMVADVAGSLLEAESRS